MARGQYKHASPGQQKLWQAMRMAKPVFTYGHLQVLTEAPKCTVKSYVLRLAQAGYLRRVGTERPAAYQLVRDTGPQPPMLRRDGSVYDANRDVVFGEVARVE